MTFELSKETEQSLQAYIAQKGLKNAAAKLVDEAVETFLFRQMFSEAHEQNANVDIEKARADIEDAVNDYRRTHHR